eukprot:scaffold276530_cov26-Tisochrysis_lutea.AAC.1
MENLKKLNMLVILVMYVSLSEALVSPKVSISDSVLSMAFLLMTEGSGPALGSSSPFSRGVARRVELCSLTS